MAAANPPDTRPAVPRSPSYRLYIDESGDHTYRHLDRPGRRHLGVLGLWFERKTAYSGFAANMEKLKVDLFGANPDEPVTLHRKDIVEKRGCFGTLQNPAKCLAFEQALLKLVDDSDFTMVCVVIDKARHQERDPRPSDPYHDSLSCLIERYCGWLDDRSSCGDVWAECRGGKEDRALQSAYLQIHELGTRCLGAEAAARALTSKEIKLRDKRHNIPGLQLADLLAHPVKVEALIERGVLTDPGPYFGRDLAQTAARKYCRRGARIEDSGLIWL